MNIAQIEENIKNLTRNVTKETFIYDLLLAYGLPKASITLLRKGNLNLSNEEGIISWKKKLYFKEVSSKDLYSDISEIEKNIKHNERFLIVTDYKQLLAIDTKTSDRLDIAIKELNKHYDFFLPWAGIEKTQHIDENPADVKAADKMAKLFDIIKKDNPDNSPEFIHSLNIFLSRLLFCYFAEDTGIFTDNEFTNVVDSHTQADGSDLNDFLDKFFEVLNTPEKKRKKLPEYLNNFPYVNGGLFKEKYAAPKFSRKSRAAIINSGDQNWSAINPDIFGSMFQAVIGADQRGNLGQHYTSVPNIMKVIEPLFLNEFYEEFDKAIAVKSKKEKNRKLDELLNRIYNLKIFDPACGSGNFLIIAYKELRILEMKIFKAGEMMGLSRIHLSQFYGIEIDDFAGEIAKLALWLAEHQMNVEFYKEFGRSNPTLPLKEAGNIVQGNACRLDWEKVCPKESDFYTNNKNPETAEVYILGNPPYLGYSKQNKEQKEDMKLVFSNIRGMNVLDYITCWYFKGADYIKNSQSKFAFVTTNSICQGEQVALLWPSIFERKLEIFFAHQSFKWTNNAKGNAGVTVAIIGLSVKNQKDKTIYYNGIKRKVKHINSYLVDSYDLFIKKRQKPLSVFPQALRGSGATDNGHLILTENEMKEMISKYPKAKEIIKRYIGSYEYINNINRYCLWIESKEKVKAYSDIIDRIKKVENFRAKSKKEATKKMSKSGHLFAEKRYISSNSTIILPRVSSERREYIPFGFVSEDVVISDSAGAIYNSPVWHFSILTSRMHMTWMRTVAGRLKTDYRYSSTLVYNTFPFPPISEQRKNELTQSVFRIIDEREKFPERTLAELYDPDKMPDGLREAHRINDLIVEKCYRSTPFKSDEERLEYLFKLYEKMIAEEEEQQSLFDEKKKKGKKK